MKCIKNATDGSIKRVKNEEAETLIKSKAWVFCSRMEWKEKVRDIKLAPVENKDADNSKASKSEDPKEAKKRKWNRDGNKKRKPKYSDEQFATSKYDVEAEPKVKE